MSSEQPSATAPSDHVTALQAELATTDGSRLARSAARAHLVVRVLAMVVVGAGVAALVVGAAAFRHSVAAQAIVGLTTLPAIVLPLYVVRRTSALARAAAHPRQLADQARDLVGSVRDSAELRALAQRLPRGSARPHPLVEKRKGRVRGALEVARLTSAVVGEARPDPERHDLLVAFTPDRLARTWAAATWSGWAGLAALAVLAVALPILVVSLF